MEAPLILLGLFFFLVLPVLAIGAYLRAQRLREELDQLSQHTYKALTNRLFELEKKIAAIEKRLAGDAPPVAEPAPATTAEPAPRREAPGEAAPPPRPTPPREAPPVRPAPPPRSAPAPAFEAPPPLSPPPKSVDWEALIAGRWMNIVGIVALILAVSFFLKYAFENNWIGPTGRVALGLVNGVALLVFSQWLLRKKYVYFSEGIAGLGGGVMYLSLFAAWGYYNLIPQAASFVGMIVVTLALMVLAAGRDSERIALLALAGGFLTPVLLSTGVDRQMTLFSYLAALDAGLLVIARLRQWRIVEPVAFVATQIFFWGWYGKFWAPEKLVPTALFATLFFLLFSALPLVRLRRSAALAPEHLVLVLSNAFAYLLALRAVFWPDYRWTLTFAVLALAVFHLLVAQRIPRDAEPKGAGVPLVRLLYAGLALTFATLAIPIRLEGRWVTIAWAIEGAVLVWSGFAGRVRQLRSAGLFLLGIVLFRLVAFPIGAETFLLNARLLTWLLSAACLAAAAWFARGREEDYFTGEEILYGTAVVAANAVTVFALSVEIWDALGRMQQPLGMSAGDARALALALLWIAYGTALVVAGFLRDVPGLRWQGLPLMLFAAGWLIFQSAAVEIVLLNPRFFVYLVAVVCVAVIARLARAAAPAPPDPEQALYSGAPVALNLLLLVALSHEVWDLFARVRTIEDVRLAQSMGLSLLWALYATALILVGVRRAAPVLRWMALLLFGVVVLKVFFFDLSFLERAYRILSFFVLGVALMVVSFFYTRRLAKARSNSGEGGAL
jgi:uncharacterized membrane protein